MSTATTDERRRSFDQMVELYARARPAPPPELFDALAAYVPPPADALEIGCGPGNASLPLLERGFRIHAVELGENLAAFARERLAAFPFTVGGGQVRGRVAGGRERGPRGVQLRVPLARPRARAAPGGEGAQARRRAGADLGLAPPHRRGQPRRRGDPGGVPRPRARDHARDRRSHGRQGRRRLARRCATRPSSATTRSGSSRRRTSSTASATWTRWRPSRITRRCRRSSARGCSTPSARSSTASSAGVWSGIPRRGCSSRGDATTLADDVEDVAPRRGRAWSRRRRGWRCPDAIASRQPSR